MHPITSTVIPSSTNNHKKKGCAYIWLFHTETKVNSGHSVHASSGERIYQICPKTMEILMEMKREKGRGEKRIGL